MVKKLKQQYDTPSEGWNGDRINREKDLMEEYGLKNKQEVYRAQSELRDLRRQARNVIGNSTGGQESKILSKAQDLGLVPEDSGLEDILTLDRTDFLDRRLQTAVYRKGRADTLKHARQLVSHGKVKVDGHVVDIPSYMLSEEEEKSITVETSEQEQQDEQQEEDDEQ